VQRRKLDLRSRAVRRVAEYLHALGLSDVTRTDTLAEEIVAACTPAQDGNPSVEIAVAAAQERVDRFRQEVFGQDAELIDPLWLRTFLAACPDVFLGDPEAARNAARRFGDPRSGQPPLRASFRDQSFRRAHFPRWALGLLPAVLTTAAATAALLTTLAPGGWSSLELLWVGLFAFLFGLAATGLSTALLGFALGLRPRKQDAAIADGCSTAPDAALPRTALVMPIYHENAEHVFAAVAAMRESLESMPGGEAFEIFVLSDSRQAERAAEEERAWRRIAQADDARVPVYYRRRARNDRQKAGNLAEFFERWGHRYTYAVVLDADSLMRGDTLMELVRRMEAEPRLALLQAPLSVHSGTTLFARALQLAHGISGPLLTRGLAAWSGPQGNYYGHNAVLRVRAFLDCCALPVLAGEPPLGGHILSHDFVEAALLCRAGWEVRIADDLDGSWEELPATFSEYIARDRRWCQGNFQHLRIAMAEGLKPMSRVHMLVGAASYLAGPLWLMFLALGVLLARSSAESSGGANLALALTAAPALLLLGPRLLGLCDTLRSAARRRAHGGALRLIASAAIETLFSATMAPLMMVHHVRIVASILMGRSVRWSTQQRGAARSELSTTVRAELPATLLGGLAGAGLWQQGVMYAIWLSPVWVPLLFAIPIALLASSSQVGGLLAKAGLLAVPSETEPDELILRASDLRALTIGDAAARFRDLILDPVLIAAHLARLLAKPITRDTLASERLARLGQRALRMGPAALSAAERDDLAADAESMRWLHREAWRHWPVESWQLAREQPQLPPEPS
jgi:membrane glycosyltransferase